MKSMVIRKLKEYGYKKVANIKLEHYNFYTLCFFLKQVERGEVLK